MAELTPLDEKLGEVLGLAQAAQDATKKVEKLLDDDALKATLQRQRSEAEETEERCKQLIDGLEGRKTKIQEKARETKREAGAMLSTYLGDDGDDLDGFEFLTMAEAGELGHWEIVRVMAEKTGDADARALAEWAVPIQRKHFEEAQAGTLELAVEEVA
jgi:hypothetical protein